MLMLYCIHSFSYRIFSLYQTKSNFIWHRYNPVIQRIICSLVLLHKYLLEHKGLLLLVDQSLQLVRGQKVLHLLGGHHSQEHLREDEG